MKLGLTPAELRTLPYEDYMLLSFAYSEEIKQEQEWKKTLLRSNGAKIR